MYRLVPYNETMRSSWESLALNRGTVFHSLAFREILTESFGYQPAYYAVMDDANEVRGLLPLVQGRDLTLSKAAVSLPFVNHLDICADSDSVRQFVMEHLPSVRTVLGLNYLTLRLKDQALDDPGWQQNRQHYTFLLPLSDEENEVLSLSSSANRNHVRKVYKNNWFAASFDRGHLDAFYRVYVRRMKELGSPSPSIRFFRQFFTSMPDRAHLLTAIAQDTGEVVGGMLLLASSGDKTLYYPYGAGLVAYNNRYLNNFLYWEAVRLGIRLGLKTLDLGRSQAGSGTYRYKEQWGAVPQQLLYAVYPTRGSGGDLDKNKLHLFIELWKMLPAGLTDRLGPQLIRYLLP